MRRVPTNYPGVYYREVRRLGKKGIERVYYVTFNRDGEKVEEKVGRQFKDDMTPGRADRIRGALIEGKRPTAKEQRQLKREEAKKKTYTVDRLAEEYFSSRPEGKSRNVDQCRYDLHLKSPFGGKEPKDILPLDVDRVRLKLLKMRSPQTVKHVLNLLGWIIHFGVKKQLCSGLSFHFTKPTVNNLKTEDLSPQQLSRLLKAIDDSEHKLAGNMMKMALFTGMRRGELFKLKWPDVDFERGFIHIRDPKGGHDQVIPLSDSVRKLLEGIPKSKSEYVFPGLEGKERTEISREAKSIRDAAGLPATFRPLHGLRHTYASMLASSGQVDLYTIQRLLTHKDPRMTQRYAHLRDETLRRASNLAGGIISEAIKPEEKKEKVVSIDKEKA
jgi:integrase